MLRLGRLEDDVAKPKINRIRIGRPGDSWVGGAVTVLPPLRAVSPVNYWRRRRTTCTVLCPGRRRPPAHGVDLDARASILGVGREPATDIALEWDAEFASHAVFERVGASSTLIDDGLSRNGLVNGERLRGRRQLRDGNAVNMAAPCWCSSACSAGAHDRHDDPRSAAALSQAQRRVLDALCAPAIDDPRAGPAANREIAATLFLSVETVKSHLHALYELFEVEDLPPSRKRVDSFAVVRSRARFPAGAGSRQLSQAAIVRAYVVMWAAPR